MPIDYRSIRVNQLAPHRDSEFGYHYDFGDNWRHTVVLEETVPREQEPDQMPVCESGGGACPRENCGGAVHYSEMVAAFADSQHPEHAESRRLNGRRWDPERFDLAGVNHRLDRLVHGDGRRRMAADASSPVAPR